VRMLDTAAAYGDIEPRLRRLAKGLPLRIISKVPAIPDLLAPEHAAEFALQSARQSRERLGPALRGLMLHRDTDLAGTRGDAVWAVLSEWGRAEGVALGVSCYEPIMCAQLAAARGISLAQLPGNALDQRLARVAADSPLRGVEIHLRSAFLQGLLLMPLAQAARRLPVAAGALERWHAGCAARGLTPLLAALSVAKAFNLVSAVVVGVDSLAQWVEIACAWERARPELATELACDQPEVIDPRLWSAAA
jgi:aryl-alcohol dehydrogenase-like predicted oxidoreductase